MLYLKTDPKEIIKTELSKSGKGLKIQTTTEIIYITIEHIISLHELEEIYNFQQEKEKAYASL